MPKRHDLTEEQRIEKRRAYQREYYKRKYHEDIEKSREKARENMKKWRRENPEKEHIIKLRYYQKIVDSDTLVTLSERLQSLCSLAQNVSPSAKDKFIRAIDSAVSYIKNDDVEDNEE